ncbi:hypothetical protein JW949_02780 [Candidatus Woesearchaeota archaeon]|nr:hypothetical protein [Candidatus Woesearchaeota archaeon]
MLKLKKPLLPTLKEKKRYIVYRIISERKINKDVSKDIIDKINSYLGVFEGAKAGIMNVTYNKNKQAGILKVSNKKLKETKSSISLINELNKQKVIITNIYVSGILKKAKNKLKNIE